MRVKATAGYLACALFLALALGVTSAQASRGLEENILATSEELFEPKPEGQIEGACGLAISPSPGSNLYVSDYYHHVVDVFSLSGGYTGKQFELEPLHGVCGLVFDSAGNLYANEWHERVLRLRPTVQTFDSNESTGVAVDKGGNVYVNDRTYVAVYEPSGAPLLDEGVPLRIGLGSLGDAYGLAVDGAGRVYVPDAEDNTVKVYEPTVDPIDPVATIEGPEPPDIKFVSLVDAAVTIDPKNGHLLVADNLQPGFEHPRAAIYEFDSSGVFLDQLSGAPIHGGPSGLAVDPATGKLFVTTGNSEKANVFAYGPYTALGSLAPPAPGEAPDSAPGGSTAVAPGAPANSSAARSTAASASEVVQRRGVRVSFGGKLTPHALPRHGAAPVGIAVDARIAAASGGAPPQLRKIAIAINRNGHFAPWGLPLCRLPDIQPSTTAGALAACGSALVGEGHFSANVKLPEQSPFPSDGKVLAFNGRLHGKPAILAHIYGTQPAPTSTVLPFLIEGSHGTYGTTLEASLPQATGDWGFVTGLRMTLRRRFSYRGRGRSYLNAGCPAPAGFPSAVFPLARTSFAFAGGMTLISVLSRTCKARG